MMMGSVGLWARCAPPLLAIVLAFAPQAAFAESEERNRQCEREAVACRNACAQKCGLLEFECRRQCGQGACREQFERCLEGGFAREDAPLPRLRPERPAEPPKREAKPRLQRQGSPRTAPKIAPTIAAPPVAAQEGGAAPAAPGAGSPPAGGETAAPAPPAAAAAAPDAASAPAPAERVQAMEAPAASGDAKLNGRILFLGKEVAEPSAEYHGYLLLGAHLSDRRREAVAQAIACRLEALPSAEAAAAVKRLGLFSLPALREAGATRVTKEDVLAAYDFERAARWLRAAEVATGQSFSPNSAIVFVGSRFARAVQMDGAVLPSTRDGLDPVVADASGLSATFAAAWVGQVVDGLESGRVRSRQELQSLMEATSWLDWANQPLLSLFRVGPKEGEEAPKACPT